MVFFLSSPPHPPPQPQFFSANPFTFHQQQYAPTTPSPLRTSYNANALARNRMSYGAKSSQHSLSSPISKPSSAAFFNSAAASNEDNDENAPFLSAAPPAPHTDPRPTSSVGTPFTFTFSASSNDANRETKYAARSRATTPQSQLQTHATTRKNQSKQKFLDRIRTRRDEGFGLDERVLRADWVTERRRWEGEMRRHAGDDEEMLEGEEVEDEVGMHGEGEDQGDVSPTEQEEREIEALVEYLERQGDQQENADQGSDGESEEWDEVFMEVLSQQEQIQQGQGGGQLGDGGGHEQDGGSMDVDMT